MFTPVRIHKLFAVVVKDHIGKVISALGDTGACHFIERTDSPPGLARKKNLISFIDGHIDEILFRIPERKKAAAIDIDISSDADQMLSDLVRDVLSSEKITAIELMGMKNTLMHLKSVYDALENCEETRYTYFFQAWVPEGSQEVIRGSIQEASYGQSVVAFSNPEFGETPPTMLANPGIMKPFENLVKRYGLPSYYELDPTWIIFLTFPLIFGMMYGDVGHGLVLFFLSATIFFSGERRFRKIRKFKEFSPILMVCSLFSMFFGFLYGEFFGVKFTPLWLNPAEHITYFLILSLWVGVAHLIVGFILNGVNFWKNKKYLRAVFQIQWIIFSISSVTFVIRFMALDPLWSGAYYAALLVLILMPVAGMIAGGVLISSIEGKGGLSGVLVPFYLGLKYAMHLMSYMRLLIMALAHFTISATVIAMSGKSAISLIIAGIITFVLIIVVETFVVFIQTLRLHWVEWFYLFYKGRGKEFLPFRKVSEKYLMELKL